MHDFHSQNLHAFHDGLPSVVWDKLRLSPTFCVRCTHIHSKVFMHNIHRNLRPLHQILESLSTRRFWFTGVNRKSLFQYCHPCMYVDVFDKKSWTWKGAVVCLLVLFCETLHNSEIVTSSWCPWIKNVWCTLTSTSPFRISNKFFFVSSPTTSLMLSLVKSLSLKVGFCLFWMKTMTKSRISNKEFMQCTLLQSINQSINLFYTAHNVE